MEHCTTPHSDPTDFSFSPFAQIIQFHENLMWNSNGNTFLSKSLSTSSARQHVFILISQYSADYRVKNPSRETIGPIFTRVQVSANLYIFKYTVLALHLYHTLTVQSY